MDSRFIVLFYMYTYSLALREAFIEDAVNVIVKA